MMKKLYLYVCIGFLCSCIGFSQNLENANWVFGIKNTIDFIPLTVGTVNVNYVTTEGCASVSDRYGNLLCYTDGIKLYNGASVEITNSLRGDPSSSQNVIIVRKPLNPLNFYIITNQGINSRSGLYFSEVTFANGTGAIVGTPNQVLEDHDGNPINELYDTTSEAITSTLHGDGNSYWVIAHVGNGVNPGRLYSYLVTSAGIDTNPIGDETVIGNSRMVKLSKGTTTGDALNTNTLAFSTSANGLFLGGFNNMSGAININPTPLLSASINSQLTYGLEFSPDSDILYYSGRVSGTNHTITRLHLPSMSATTINKGSMDTRAIQLALDGRIYVSHNNSILGVITNPNNITNPNFIDASLTLTNASRAGLPQWVEKLSCESTLFDNVDVPLNFQTIEEQRRDSIFATNRVNVEAKLIYHAGRFIELLPDVNSVSDTGFEAEFGSQFVAEIVDCDTAFIYKNGKTGNQYSDESKDFVASNKINIFPNPSNTSLTVSYNEALKNIRILSMDGKTIFTRNANEKEFQIDVSTFVNGMYLITAETQNGQFLQSKFIKN